MHVSRARDRVNATWLTDTCAITTATEAEFDPGEGTYVTVAGDSVFAGACRVSPATAPSVVQAGDSPVPLRHFNVFLPWDTVDVELDHVVTITASTDPHLVGRRLRVVDVQGMTDGVYRHLLCEDLLTVDYLEEEVGS